MRAVIKPEQRLLLVACDMRCWPPILQKERGLATPTGESIKGMDRYVANREVVFLPIVCLSPRTVQQREGRRKDDGRRRTDNG